MTAQNQVDLPADCSECAPDEAELSTRGSTSEMNLLRQVRRRLSDEPGMNVDAVYARIDCNCFEQILFGPGDSSESSERFRDEGEYSPLQRSSPFRFCFLDSLTLCIVASIALRRERSISSGGMAVGALLAEAGSWMSASGESAGSLR